MLQSYQFYLKDINIVDSDQIVRAFKKKGKSVILEENEIRGLIVDNISKRKPFIIESNWDTGITYGYSHFAKEKGYKIKLIYLGVSDLDILNQRVSERKTLGLHYISPNEVRIKYIQALERLPQEIQKFDSVVLLDNSGIEPKFLLELRNQKIIFK